MFGAGIRTVPHLGRILRRRAYGFLAQGGEAFEEPREEGGHAQHVVSHQHLAVTRGSGADADRRDRQLTRDPGGHRLRNQFEHDRKSAGLLGPPPSDRTDWGFIPSWAMTGMPATVSARIVSA